MQESGELYAKFFSELYPELFTEFHPELYVELYPEPYAKLFTELFSKESLLNSMPNSILYAVLISVLPFGRSSRRCQLKILA